MQRYDIQYTGRSGGRGTGLALFLLLALLGSSLRLAAQAATRHLTFTLKYTLTCTEPLDWEEFTVLLPQGWAGRQQVVAQAYDPKAAVKFFKQDDRWYAIFHLNNPRETETITITTEANLLRCDFATLMQHPPKVTKLDAAALAPYLKREKLIEVDAKRMEEAAKTIPGTTDVELVQGIMNYVTAHLNYSGFRKVDTGALWALVTGEGDCSEFSALFVALCRAKGIPARRITGFCTARPNAVIKEFHNWAEAYLPAYGWVPFDPWLMKVQPAAWNTLPNTYVYLAQSETDPALHDQRDFYCTSKRKAEAGSGAVKVEEEAMCLN